MSVCCDCRVLSDKCLCVRLITCPQSPTKCGVSECDHKASIKRRPWPTRGCCAIREEGIAHICNCRNWNGSVGIDAGIRDGQPWICVSILGRVKRLFSSAKCPDRLCGPTCFLFNVTGGVSPVIKSQSVKLTTYPISR
jgi:hypothetical protein